MHQTNTQAWQHDHTFNQDREKAGEKRTLTVVVITAVMMVVEIVAGLAFGSMALFADGLHMASHAVALSISVFAYVYARRRAGDERFSFGTGKVNALGGFTGAILLALVAAAMAFESVKRLIHPEAIEFNQAILVAVIGLAVNGISIFILDHKHDHSHGHDHGSEHVHDHNLRSAYMHVIADALTSVLAIAALLAGKYFGWIWMDAATGILGALLVWRWAVGLLKLSSHVLLDKQGSEAVLAEVKKAVEGDGDARITDLHVWAVGPNIFSAIISLVAHHPKQPSEYKKQIPAHLGIVHVTVEVSLCHSNQKPAEGVSYEPNTH
jgi:cation diffusion facilitator family transporter